METCSVLRLIKNADVRIQMLLAVQGFIVWLMEHLSRLWIKIIAFGIYGRIFG